MKDRKKMLLVVLLMAVGFAAVSTTLYINGQTTISTNQDDFNVYYSDAYVNGEQDKSVITDDTHIVFTTELSGLGEKYILDYEVTNGSKNYDAELEMVCTGGNDYLSVTNEFDDESILFAQAKRTGKLTLEQIKSYAGDEDLEVTIDCEISANATERDSLAKSGIVVVATDENDVDLNAEVTIIEGSDSETLINDLITDGYITSKDEVDALINIETDSFTNVAHTIIDVSSIAEPGKKIAIFHYEEETQEWEYLATVEVDENGMIINDFESFSPVALVVVDGKTELVNHTKHLDNNSDLLCDICGKQGTIEYTYHKHTGSSTSGGGCYGKHNTWTSTCGARISKDYYYHWDAGAGFYVISCANGHYHADYSEGAKCPKEIVHDGGWSLTCGKTEQTVESSKVVFK